LDKIGDLTNNTDHLAITLTSTQDTSEPTVTKLQQIDIDRYILGYRTTGEAQVISFREECPWIRGTDRYTHLIHRYPAKLLAHIPVFFFASSLCPDNATVLDPFAGSGTVLLEAMLSGHQAFGAEINPVARLIAKVKTHIYSTSELEEEVQRLLAFIKLDRELDISLFPNIDLWFTSHVQAGLTKIKYSIDTVPGPRYRDFFWLAFSSLVRRVALADPRVSPPVVLKPKKFAEGSVRRKQVEDMLKDRRNADVVSLFTSVLEEQIKRFRRLEDDAKERKLGEAQIIWDDARTLSKAPIIDKGQLDKTYTESFPDSSVDLVITSPPYLNAQKYARSLRLEWYWLDLGPYEAIRAMDASMMGSERILYEDYNELQQIGHPIADQIIQETYQIDRHRSRVLSKYYQDMRICINQIYRVLKSGGHLVLVIGNNRVFKQRVPNQHILKDFAIDEGFRLNVMFVDEIFSRGLMTKRNTTADLIPDEWVLVFEK